MADKILQTRFSLRADTSANWALIDPVLLKGEAGVELFEGGKAKIKIGDGTLKWSQLPYAGGEEIAKAQVFEATALAEQTDEAAITAVVGAAALQEGDVAIVKRLIHGEKYEYTAYVYNGTAWKAMDGNYNAENVYFDEDLMTTSAVGNITLTNGQATISAQGKNLKEVFQTIFVKEQQPTVTQPSATVKLTQAGSYEVGSTLTPAYTTSFNVGSYSYGPATGITVSAWEVSDGVQDHDAVTTASGSFPELTVIDGINYKLTAKATHTEGAIPKTNIGNEAPSKKIASGTKSATSSAITGYRNSFYGTYASKDGTVDSTYIRGLSGKSGKALANGSTFTISLPAGAQRVVFAYPASLREVNSVKDVNGLNAEIKSAFTMNTVKVAGANEYAPQDYRVYITDFAAPLEKANSYTVQI